MYQIISHKNVSLHDLYKTTLSIGNLCLFRWTWWLLAGGFYRLPISIFMVWNSRSVYAKVFWVKEFPPFKYLMPQQPLRWPKVMNLDSDLKWIRQKFYQFFINDEIPKEFWKNSHFKNIIAGFLLRSQNTLRWIPLKRCIFRSDFFCFHPYCLSNKYGSY